MEQNVEDETSRVVVESTVRLWCRSGLARRIREGAGATCAGTARLAATTSANVSRWESGTRVPTGWHAVRYYRALVQLQEIAAAATEAATA